MLLRGGTKEEVINYLLKPEIKAIITKGSLIVFLTIKSGQAETRAQIAAPLAMSV